MGRRFGGQNMYEPLRSVLVKRPDEQFSGADPAQWHYASRPDLKCAVEEHDALVAILRNAGVEVYHHTEAQPGRADAIYVFDPVLLTDEGAVVLQMGKKLRRGEEEVLAGRLRQLGIPVIHVLAGEAHAEGGDLLWLANDTLAVGLGFRTNRLGLRQLGERLAEDGVGIVPVELPYYKGPDACLHLLSLISILDSDLAVVFRPLLSVPFVHELEARGYHLVDVPEEEFTTMGTNVLALAPRKGIALEGNSVTRLRLEDAGCEILTYRGEEISLKAEGGPTCLTRPILRRR